MTDPTIAYFSMEIELEPAIPTYAGGLGVLAGDTLRGAADLGLPMVAVSLLHRKGYLDQVLESDGRQIERPVEWAPDSRLLALRQRVSVTAEDRQVQLRCWQYDVGGVGGAVVAVYLLDADLPSNDANDRRLTDFLYGGDATYRLKQEIILGVGGVRMLRALGYDQIQRFHMNEGHSSLLTAELLDERMRAAGRTVPADEDVQAVRGQCVFTTHTPVPAGHDTFPIALVTRLLGARHLLFGLKNLCCVQDTLNLTLLALNLSHYVNGVSMEHGEVSRQMFGGYRIDAITNGIHLATWTSDAHQALFDRYVPGWRHDNFSLRYALSIANADIWDAHMQAKRQLIDYVNAGAGPRLDANRLTIGFARRVTAYKRPDLLLDDPERLKRIATTVGPFQVLFAGKAHPNDEGGKDLIRRIVALSHSVRPAVEIVYLPNYDATLGRLMVAGVDLWLNTPQPPLEASGTSGMKAAVNGVPSVSVLDGWWVEGHLEGMTGWAIGNGEQSNRESEATDLYDKLERVIVPMFYGRREQYIDIMRHAIAVNGAFFNTQRMLQEYVLKAYGRGVVC